MVVVVECDPVTDHAHRMSDAFEAVAMRALFPERPDEALDHAVLLRAVRGDELLLQPVAADDGREVVAGEDEPIVRAQQELPLDPAQGVKPGDQRVLQGSTGDRGLALLRQVPAQQLARVAVDHQRQRGPAVPAGPDAGEIGRPSLVRRGGDGRHALDAGPYAHVALADLPAPEPKYPLHSVLVEASSQATVR